MRLTHASVFSGIGGPEIAATMLGWDNAFHCEINDFGRKILEYWYPNSKSYEDITKTDFSEWRGRVDVLTGGFPCQPFSYAGQRRGAEDDRYLWPSMYRAIDEIQPTWVVAENVAGILTMVEQGEVSKVASPASLFAEINDVRGQYQLRETFTLQRICTDLEGHGYAVQPILIPACAVGAPHRRDRVFIVARRIASDSDNRTDRRTAGEDEGKGGAQRVQERHEVRKPDEPNQVRPEGATIPEDSMHSRQLYGQDEVEGCERNIGNVGAGGGERICSGTSRADSPDTEGECGQRMRPEQSETRGTSQEQSGGRGGEDGHDQSFADTSWHRLARLLQREEHGDARWQGQVAQDIADHIRSVSPDYGRWEAFPSVSPVHRGNDGLPFPLDDLAIHASKWRTESLKAYGNAIVPQVIYEIFRAIEIVEREKL